MYFMDRPYFIIDYSAQCRLKDTTMLISDHIYSPSCHISSDINVQHASLTKELRGHPFMTSTRRGGGGRAQVDACGQGKGVQPHVDVHRKLKLESTDVILSSSHAKKLVSFFTRISSLDRKKVDIFLRYKLVI